MPKMLIATDKEEKKSEQCNVNVAKVLQGVSLMLQNIKNQYEDRHFKGYEVIKNCLVCQYCNPFDDDWYLHGIRTHEG